MEWELTELKIELAKWGEFAGKYVGKITFQTKQSDCFMFTLSPGEMTEYLAIVSKKVSLSANELGQKVFESMKSLGFDESPILKIEAHAKEEPNIGSENTQR